MLLLTFKFLSQKVDQMRKQRLKKSRLEFSIKCMSLSLVFYWVFLNLGVGVENETFCDIVFLESPFKLIYLAFIDKNTFKLHNNADYTVFHKLYGHHGLFRLTEHSLDITSLTTIKRKFEPGYNVFPFKHEIFNPPLKTGNGQYDQGLAGISRELSWKEEYDALFKKYSQNKNPSNFLNLKEKDLAFLSHIVDQNNIIIQEETLFNLNETELDLLRFYSQIKTPLLKTHCKSSWGIFEKQKFSEYQRFDMLLESKLLFHNLGNFNHIVKIQEKLIQQIQNKNPSFDGCLDYPAVTVSSHLENHEVDDP